MKATIIAIVGASGSGKTCFSRLLQNELNVFAIVSHTTRPKRENEIAGKDYYFIGRNQVYPFGDMLTHTKFGGYEYFALREQVPPEGYCSYVVDESGVQALKRMQGERYRIVSVLVRSNYSTLEGRGIDEERIFRDRTRKQLPEDFYDFIIDNDGTLAEYEENIRETFQKIRLWQPQK
ncbi:hypothetical protein [Bacteroides fragilis]|uniref:hypothetical protein n=1 Tax=Bacteroides fragilis TaxID=817 RepID=UPI0018A0FD5D|nr:hypothetical protein [Bacteroides fragilis]